MADTNHIRNPFEMAVQGLSGAASDASRIDPSRVRPVADAGPVAVRHITVPDLRDALRQGFSDLAVTREDVVFAALIYPIAGLVLAEIFLNHNWLPLIFPLASGFALLGPLAAVGLYEISRLHEQGRPVTWRDGFELLRAPQLGQIFLLGLMMVAIFLAWLAAAGGIYTATLGPTPPASLDAFARETFGTGAGWTMIVVGVGVGFLFAVLALAVSVVSFPLLIDRGGSVARAVEASVLAVAANPVPMALWGLIVAGLLALGSIPALFGLILVVPWLGHATWRLYRKLIGDAPAAG
jgi:uncharacterized membrane protein